MASNIVIEVVEHKFFVSSRLSRDSFQIKNYLDNTVKRGLPLDGENGEYTYHSSNLTPRFLFDLFEFQGIEPDEHGFQCEYMKMIISENEIALHEQLDQVKANDDTMIEYHAIFKIDRGNQFVRVKIIGKFESAGDRWYRENQGWLEFEDVEDQEYEE